MNVKLTANRIKKSKITVLSSKSELHRLLILSAFAKTESIIEYSGSLCLDVLSTIGVLKAVGAKIKINKNRIKIVPVQTLPEKEIEVDCGESGSTLRFVLPVLSAKGIKYKINVKGRLGERPLSPLREIMQEGGSIFSEKGKYPLSVSGKFCLTEVKISGDVSSQFISGLLLAYAASNNGGSVTVEGDFQSKPYVDITVEAIKKFGIKVETHGTTYTVFPAEYSGIKTKAFGDWSNGAFFIALGVLGKETETVGLDENSKQGDREIVNALKNFGGKVSAKNKSVIAKSGELFATAIDAKNIPDLVPVLCAVAATSKGTTVVENAERLRLKESDRIKTVIDMINSLGGEAEELENGLKINGKKTLVGGTVDSHNDHRIVMSAAVLSVKCSSSVVIKNAEAVDKSYPDFFKELKKTGITIEEI